MTNFFRLVILFLFTWNAAAIAATEPRVHETGRLKGVQPVIDGKLEDEAWNAASWAGGFTQFEPYNGKAATEQTRFRILYNDDFIFVAIHALDSSPSEIVRRVTRRDNDDGDWVGVMFDSYNDNQTGFGFTVSAAGVKTDLLIINDGQDDNTWDAVWESAVSLDASGWSAEFRIPLSQLRFSGAVDLEWGLQVFRYVYRRQEMSLWQPIPRDAPGFVSYFGDLRGLDGIRPKKDIELLPYVVTKAEYSLKQEGNPYADGDKYRAIGGMDGKVSITSDMTLNFTINPDFGQVEADPSEVNLTAYETFYTEKRPFFIEGKNIFDFSMTSGNGDATRNMLFYSRRIGRQPHYSPSISNGEYADIPGVANILGSFKFSGKTRQGLSVGILESLTGREQARILSNGSESRITTEPLTNYFVGRLVQDYNKGNSILGGMFTATNRFIRDTHLEFLPSSAYTGGIDYKHFWKEKSYFYAVRGIFSHITGTQEAISGLQQSSARYFQSPDKDYVRLDETRESLSGHAGTFEIGKTGNGHFSFLTWLTWRSPGIEFNDLGYMRQADEIQYVYWAGYNEFEPKGIFRSYGIECSTYAGWNFGGENLYRGISPAVYAIFKNYWQANINADYSGWSLERTELRGGPAFILPGGTTLNGWLQTDNRKKLVFEFSASNYFGNRKHSESHNYTLGITLKPLNALSLSLCPGYSTGTGSFQYVTTAEAAGASRYIVAGIDRRTLSMSVRLNYCITPDLSVQYYGQPFLFSGKYHDYKRITNPRADKYEDRFIAMVDGVDMLRDNEQESWKVDENKDGITDYYIGDNDFNFMEFRSNLVARWEYKTGSALYLVWSQGRNASSGIGELSPAHDTEALFGTHPNDIFLLKFSYILMF